MSTIFNSKITANDFWTTPKARRKRSKGKNQKTRQETKLRVQVIQKYPVVSPPRIHAHRSTSDIWGTFISMDEDASPTAPDATQQSLLWNVKLAINTDIK